MSPQTSRGAAAEGEGVRDAEAGAGGGICKSPYVNMGAPLLTVLFRSLPALPGAMRLSVPPRMGNGLGAPRAPGGAGT